jgi:hypothetical protein
LVWVLVVEGGVIALAIIKQLDAGKQRHPAMLAVEGYAPGLARIIHEGSSRNRADAREPGARSRAGFTIP